MREVKTGIPGLKSIQLKAAEDGDLRYLYIKDRTWALTGAACAKSLK
ncbi:MAG TPA: hypothetical protein VGA12_02820 [Burkholderiales bacterium]